MIWKFNFFMLIRINKYIWPMTEDYMLIFAGVVVVVPAIFLIVWLTSRGKK